MNNQTNPYYQVGNNQYNPNDSYETTTGFHNHPLGVPPLRNGSLQKLGPPWENHRKTHRKIVISPGKPIRKAYILFGPQTLCLLEYNPIQLVCFNYHKSKREIGVMWPNLYRSWGPTL